MSDETEATEVNAAAEAAGSPGGEPTEEEMQLMMYQRLATVPVQMVLIQTMASFLDMAAIRLGLGPEGELRENPGEARLAIDSLRALIPVAEVALGPQAASFKEALADIQKTFVEKVNAAGPPVAEVKKPPLVVPQAPPPPQEGGIWVPPHMRKP